MKKILSVLIAILIVCSVAIAAPLADTSVMRYKNISQLVALISKEDGGCDCTGRVNLSNVSHAEVTIYLQRSFNGGSSYTDYKVVARDTFYGDGWHTLSGTATGLSGDYMYRTKVIVKAYNSSGSVIDSGTAYSNPT